MTYGQCENSNIVKAERLLPIGLSEGAQLKRDIAKDEVISYDDVIMPPRRLCDQLRQEQDRTFNETNHLVNI
jgi:predicted homoserine dehydrogenase-like protein